MVRGLAAYLVRIALYAHFPGRIVVELAGDVGQYRFGFGGNLRRIRCEMNWVWLLWNDAPNGRI